MKFGIKTIDEFELDGRTVLIRVDMNQPVDMATGKLKSTARIKACAPTVRELAEKGAKVVVLAHQGSDIEYKNFYTTAPHREVLEGFVGRPVQFIEDVCGPAAIEKIRSLSAGDILLLDNVRFMSEEQTLFEQKLQLSHEEQAKTLVVRKLAPLADLYVCDAFAAAHRDQPTLCGFEQVLPSAMGRLFEKEYVVISELMESPARPCTFVLGGAKISDAFLMMETVLGKGTADRILTGGLVANILLIAAGKEIGQGSYDFIVKSNYGEYIEKAKKIYAEYQDRFVLPVDIAYTEDGKRKEADIGAVPAAVAATDIGKKSAAQYQEIIRSSATVFVNGPMGIFEEEETEFGTKAVWEALGDTPAYTVVGGGDSITATTKYGKTDDISYICTGGGALIRFLTGEELPVVKALRHGATI
ncbi:MAG: phosphoglycerate kinase [Lachnospiraceae bacterium]|nr:phosphoglycerate kinase [Lachnospiraceae bacterium]